MENTTKKRFDNASKKYLTDRYIWRYKSAQLVSKLVKPNESDVILDIGCGTGKQIIDLSDYIKLGIGIDISNGMIEQAIENAKNENKNNVNFYLGTFSKPDKETDLSLAGVTKIISNYALHHLNLEEKKKAIDKMIHVGGESLRMIVIGDLMFSDNPENYTNEFNTIGYGPGIDTPSTVDEMKECFVNLPYDIEIHKLHPLVGVLVATKK